MIDFFTLFSTAIVFVITIKLYDHSPVAINSLITQSACVYLDCYRTLKRMLTEIYAGNQYFIIQ